MFNAIDAAVDRSTTPPPPPAGHKELVVWADVILPFYKAKDVEYTEEGLSKVFAQAKHAIAEANGGQTAAFVDDDTLAEVGERVKLRDGVDAAKSRERAVSVVINAIKDVRDTDSRVYWGDVHAKLDGGGGKSVKSKGDGAGADGASGDDDDVDAVELSAIFADFQYEAHERAGGTGCILPPKDSDEMKALKSEVGQALASMEGMSPEKLDAVFAAIEKARDPANDRVVWEDVELPDDTKPTRSIFEVAKKLAKEADGGTGCELKDEDWEEAVRKALQGKFADQDGDKERIDGVVKAIKAARDEESGFVAWEKCKVPTSLEGDGAPDARAQKIFDAAKRLCKMQEPGFFLLKGPGSREKPDPNKKRWSMQPKKAPDWLKKGGTAASSANRAAPQPISRKSSAGGGSSSELGGGGSGSTGKKTYEKESSLMQDQAKMEELKKQEEGIVTFTGDCAVFQWWCRLRPVLCSLQCTCAPVNQYCGRRVLLLEAHNGDAALSKNSRGRGVQ